MSVRLCFRDFRVNCNFWSGMGHRYIALLLLTAMWVSILIPSVSALGEVLDEAGVLSAGNTKMSQNYAGALSEKTTSQQLAADQNASQPSTKNRKALSALTGMGTGAAPQSIATEALQPSTESKKKTYKQEEIISKRTANSTTSRNKDGSYTTKLYTSPQFYKKDGNWKDIDTKLVEDKNAGDSGNWFGKAYGAAKSWVSSTNTYTVESNDWQARFVPSGSSEDMVRIKKGNSQLGFSPVGAKNGIKPVITTDKNGQQTVHYYSLWPGVDVEYVVLAAELKENIILKNKKSANSFAFKLSGGKLKKSVESSGNLYDISGVLGDDFSIAPLTVELNGIGLETAQKPLTQSYKDGVLKFSLDKKYLSKLDNKFFPVTIDPTTVYNSSFGDRSGGNYVSFKSDGYVCYSQTCNPLAGSVLDSNGYWRSWRGLFHSSYEMVRNHKLENATLHMEQRLGLNSSGTTAVKNFWVYHARCIGYDCAGPYGGNSAFATSGNIDLTALYQRAINGNDWGAWLMIVGEETNSTTYKNFDPGTGYGTGTYVQFTYSEILPAPSVTSPAEGQVFVDPQVSFTGSSVVNPSGNRTLQDEFCVSTSGGCNGTVINSGPQATPQWTVPDGILEDGVTYYVQARGYDSALGAYGEYGPSVSFRIDSRTGKDSTQAYDTLGPVSVDLATGNMSTSAASHSSSALGGSLGVSLDYNSPLKSRNGLVGRYWNVSAGQGLSPPTSTPALTRVDRNVSFDWSLGSAAPGVIGSDWFFAQWSGYFVAPKTGTYYFGGNNDDALVVYVDGQQVYINGGCYTGICYGTGINLTAGQIVSFSADYIEATGPAYSRIYVKGAVPEQVVPNSWLQTGVRDAVQQHGLTGRYYKDDKDTRDFNDANNVMFMQRNDSLISFDWGSGPAVPGGPADFFIARWTGYLTVPTTGTYYFGTRADDGSRVKINDTTVMDNWNAGAHQNTYGSGITLAAGQVVPITVEYFEANSGACMSLLVKGPVAEQVVPSSWLSTKASVLPDGWNLGIDPDGNASYDHLKVTANSVILSDSTGSTHEYKWDAARQAYIPPVNEDGNLVRNADNTYTLQDTDGRTYVFNADGTIKSLTSPVDDQKPSALQYTYSGTPSRLTQITDVVNPDRWAKVYYSGDANCAAAPNSFDAQTPAGMLCAVKTDDGRITSFFYKNGRLARIAEPGNELTDYQYDTLGRIVAIRDSLANDAIAAGVRADDETTNTAIAYDAIGRIASVTQPAATAGATRTQHTISYLPGSGTYYGATEQHISGMAEPNGYARRVEYDSLLRTIRDTDIAGLTDTTEWDPAKDLVYSTTDETGLKSTTIYDDEDRTVSSYGPAPSAWFGSDRKPLAAYASQVPRTDTNYDEGMRGPAVAYMAADTSSRPNTLANGASLARGASLWSADGQFNFVHQSDGNLVVYGPSGVLWAAATNGSTDLLLMQNDGNLVLYSPNGARWSTGTAGRGSSTYLIMQNDGNLVLYSNSVAVWSTGTGGHASVAKPVSLTGSPKLHTTNLPNSPAGTISRDFGTTPPISTPTGSWGFRMTGRMRLPATGTYTFRLVSDGGVRLYIDDQLQLDDWNDGTNRSHWPVTYQNTAGSVHRFRLEYFHATAPTSAFSLYLTPPGATETNQTAQYFSPDYSLPTSTTTYDSALGNTTTKTNYGPNPELGLAQSTTENYTNNGQGNGTGNDQNLTTSFTYEQQGATGSFLRQTAKYLPGANTTDPTSATQYSYYSATETRDNPCTTNTTETYKQAGFQKQKTEPDPDGTGTQTPRTTETIYDDSGRAVATRYNNDNWTCTTYDDRGRTVQMVMPGINGRAGRTVISDYAYSGNPLESSITDSVTGRTVIATDLLGRAISSVDTFGYETTYEFDGIGNIVRKVSALGEEVSAYDQYGRLAKVTLDNVDYATIEYDAYGQISSVTYPQAKTDGGLPLKLAGVTYDELGRRASNSYTFSDGTIFREDTTRSIAGKLVSASTSLGQKSATSSFSYDKMGRLTNAQVDNWQYSYIFSGVDAMCSSLPGANAQAAKNGNRTQYTVTNTSSGTSDTTKYCYDQADRLLSSSDSKIGTPTYDDHGNTVSLGSSVAAMPAVPGLSAEYYMDDGTHTFPTDSDDTSRLIIARNDANINFNWVGNGPDAANPAANKDNFLVRWSGYFTAPSAGDYTFGTTNADDGTRVIIDGQTVVDDFGLHAATSKWATSAIHLAAGQSVPITVEYREATGLASVSLSYRTATQAAQLVPPSMLTAVLQDNSARISPIVFTYDALDQNTAIEQTLGESTNRTEYLKDVDGNILVKRQYKDGVLQKATRYVAGGAVVQECSLTDQTQCTTTEKNLSLPGDVSLALTPQKTEAADRQTYSISNYHGDVTIRANASGEVKGAVALYDPFGGSLFSETFNVESDYIVGQFNDFNLDIRQYGARTYIAELGRFLQQDPVPGGTENSYAYVNDPVNEDDYSGKFSLKNLVKKVAGTVKNTAKKAAKKVVAVAKSIAHTVQRAQVGVRKAVSSTVSAISKLGSAIKALAIGKSTSAPTPTARKTLPAALDGDFSNDPAPTGPLGRLAPGADMSPYGGLLIKDPIVEMIKQNPADAASLAPVIGVPFDIYTTGRDCSRKLLSAGCGLSLVGFIPVVGDTIKGGGKGAKVCAKVCDEMTALVKIQDGLNKAENAAKTGDLLKQIVKAPHVAYNIDKLSSSTNGLLSKQTLQHILDGDGTDGAHYMHSTASNFGVVKGVKAPDSFGLTKADISINGKVKQSTFFPSSYDAQEVVDSIMYAYNKKAPYSTRPNTYRGVDSNGVTIQIGMDNNGKIVTAYPIHETDLNP